MKNARAILRNALPIDNKPIRRVASELESISEALRIPGSKSLGPIERSVRTAESTLAREEKSIVGAFAPARKGEGMQALDDLRASLKEFDRVLDSKDKQDVPIIQQRCLRDVGNVEEAMVKGFPYKARISPRRHACFVQRWAAATRPPVRASRACLRHPARISDLPCVPPGLVLLGAMQRCRKQWSQGLRPLNLRCTRRRTKACLSVGSCRWRARSDGVGCWARGGLGEVFSIAYVSAFGPFRRNGWRQRLVQRLLWQSLQPRSCCCLLAGLGRFGRKVAAMRLAK